MSVTFRHYSGGYIIRYMKIRKDYWKATEWWLNGTERPLNGHWNMYLPFSRPNGDWKVTEWRLSVFTEWWRFVLWKKLPSRFTHREKNQKSVWYVISRAMFHNRPYSLQAYQISRRRGFLKIEIYAIVP